MLQTIYKHKEVLAEIGIPAANSGSGTRIYPRDDFRPRNINFTGNEEILERLPRNATAEDYFKLYIDDKMIDYIVTQTNLYVAQYLEKEQGNLRPHSLVHEWKPTDRAEMLTLLAVLILMGIIHKPRLTMYWSKDSILATPIFNQVMRRDRFLLLIRFLHFADNAHSTIQLIQTETNSTNIDQL